MKKPCKEPISEGLANFVAPVSIIRKRTQNWTWLISYALYNARPSSDTPHKSWNWFSDILTIPNGINLNIYFLPFIFCVTTKRPFVLLRLMPRINLCWWKVEIGDLGRLEVNFYSKEIEYKWKIIEKANPYQAVKWTSGKSKRTFIMWRPIDVKVRMENRSLIILISAIWEEIIRLRWTHTWIACQCKTNRSTNHIEIKLQLVQFYFLSE